MTDVGNLFTIVSVTVRSRDSGIIYEPHYELSQHGHKFLPVSYIDSSQHIKPATKAGRLLFERGKITNGTN